MAMIFLAVLCLSFLSVEAFDSCCNCRRPHMVMSTMLHIYREVDPVFMCSAGMKDGRVPDHYITASSSWSEDYSPYFGRLDNQKSFSHPSHCGAWSAKYAQAGEWIQVRIPEKVAVTGVVTQGRASNDAEEWVTQYEISYSHDGHDFVPMQDMFGDSLIFPGNHDRKTSVVNKFPHHVLAKYFRLKVLAFHGWPTLRMDFMTC